MVEDECTYTLDEIEERTGFEKRTIVYYVQEGLLPKVGRRGPRTRYPQIFLDRLLFIKKIRELQDTGAMGSMTLSEIRDVFSRISEETIAEVAAGREPLHVVDARAAPSAPRHSPLHKRKLAMARAIEKMRKTEPEQPETRHHTSDDSVRRLEMPRQSFHISEMASDPDDDLDFGPPESAPVRLSSSPPSETHRPAKDFTQGPAEAGSEDLAEALTRLQDTLKRQPRAYLRTTETWTQARITEELSLGARGLDERHRPLLERTAMLLRRLMHEKD